jgi:ribonuclease J
MNLNLYAYQDSWLMVDLGVSFDGIAGIDVIMPDPTYIVNQAKKLKGLVLTHAHEDHIGAVAHLWPLLRCPIYATPFTAAMVRNKLREHQLKDVPIIEVPLSGKIQVGPFAIEFITLTHSIPEPNALAIQTPVGTILHTGDWKLDPDPLVGEVTDVERLKAYGDQGVLALVCDSTNVFEEGSSGSEGVVRDHLIEMIKGCKNRVVVACFASNVARLEACASAGVATHRKVGIAGRSLIRIDQAARDSGYLGHIPAFLSDKEISKVPADKSLILCTGSQGEAAAALSRIAFGQHPYLKLAPGDTVIFSSRIIPGNEKEISVLQNQLIQRGIEVKTHKDSLVHVSGHPSRDELTQMYEWVRPKIAIPVHGETRHLVAHGELARQLGVPHVVVPKNGDLIEMTGGNPRCVEEVPVGRWGVDGNRVIPLTDPSVKDRLRLGSSGVCFVTALVEGNKAPKLDLCISLLGLSDPEEDLIPYLEEKAYDACENLDLAEGDDLIETLEKVIKKGVSHRLNHKPLVRIHLRYI